MIEKEPYFKVRTLVKQGFIVPRPQMRILWNLAHGAQVETWLGSLPMARMWTEREAQNISTSSVKALFRKKLIKKGRVTRDDRKHVRIAWLISVKGSKIVEEHKYGS